MVMKIKEYNHYRAGAYLLTGFAPLLILAALLTDPRGTCKALSHAERPVLSGNPPLCARGGDSVDTRLASRLSMQGILALGDIILDLGGDGAAIFLPPENDGGRVMQFIPIRSTCRSYQADGGGFTHHSGSVGTLNPPLAATILDDLKRDNDLILPREYSLLMGAIREVCEDLLSVTGRVEVRRKGDTVTLDLHNYLLLSACTHRREVSPASCTLCPCSICSLIACMIAEGLGCEVSLSQVALDETARPPLMRVHYTLMEGAGIPD